jgi:hypothetical protein
MLGEWLALVYPSNMRNMYLFATVQAIQQGRLTKHKNRLDISI